MKPEEETKVGGGSKERTKEAPGHKEPYRLTIDIPKDLWFQTILQGWKESTTPSSARLWFTFSLVPIPIMALLATGYIVANNRQEPEEARKPAVIEKQKVNLKRLWGSEFDLKQNQAVTDRTGSVGIGNGTKIPEIFRENNSFTFDFLIGKGVKYFKISGDINLDEVPKSRQQLPRFDEEGNRADPVYAVKSAARNYILLEAIPSVGEGGRVISAEERLKNINMQHFPLTVTFRGSDRRAEVRIERYANLNDPPVAVSAHPYMIISPLPPEKKNFLQWFR